MKESYQRTLLIITAFAEDDVIVTSGVSAPANEENNGIPLLGSGGIPSGGSRSLPGSWY
ncbi:MAG: hypothetical protein IJH07_08335 [Ruminococcus sp.]|nr:hypothetical protein [Ruminococcus sp.]